MILRSLLIVATPYHHSPHAARAILKSHLATKYFKWMYSFPSEKFSFSPFFAARTTCHSQKTSHYQMYYAKCRADFLRNLILTIFCGMHHRKAANPQDLPRIHNPRSPDVFFLRRHLCRAPHEILKSQLTTDCTIPYGYRTGWREILIWLQSRLLRNSQATPGQALDRAGFLRRLVWAPPRLLQSRRHVQCAVSSAPVQVWRERRGPLGRHAHKSEAR